MRARSSRHFDEQYYDEFYGAERPRRRELEDTERLCGFVCAYLQYLRLPVRNVLDIGCGLGLWRARIAGYFPRATYHGVEFSEYLCEEYGWEQGSVVDYESRTPFDLVICQDTVQYLADRRAATAIRNLGTLTRGALYFSAPSVKDWRENVDPDISDSAVHKRPAEWYRRRLARGFHNLGGGLFLSRSAPVVLWELEHL